MIKADKILKNWQLFAIILVAISLILFLIETIFHLDPHIIHMIEVIDFIIIGVFAGELIVHFISAKDKKIFLKENWLLILCLLPLARIGRLARAWPILAEIELLALPGIVNIINPRALTLVQKGVKAKHYLKNTKMGKEKKRMAVYISPHVEAKVAEGILNGLNLFLKENKVKAEFKFRKWRHVYRVEQDLIKKSYKGEIVGTDIMRELFALPMCSIVITDGKYALNNPYNLFGEIKIIGDKMIALFNGDTIVEKPSDYELDPHYMASLRGLTIGYHTAARAFSDRCYTNNCIYNELTEQNIDHFAFMTHMNKKFPKCDKH